MTTLGRGSQGQAVERLQSRLLELALYKGAVDGAFGSGTGEALKTFQKSNALPVTGIADSLTWTALFPGETSAHAHLLSAPLETRCLALTASFETTSFPPSCFAALAGDFDGQGISFGALQWNLGQGTLQPLLRSMLTNHRHLCHDIFKEHLVTLENMLARPVSDHVSLARSIQNERRQIVEPWRGMLRNLGATDECLSIQTDAAAKIYTQAKRLSAEYGLTSQRGLALMFDIAVQNGSIGSAVRAQILRDFESLPAGSDESARLQAIAKRRSAAVRLAFQTDVLARKLTIAKGQGTVHGLQYDLAGQFGLTLDPAAPPVSIDTRAA